MTVRFLTASLLLILLAPLSAFADQVDLKFWAMEARAEGRNTPFFDKGLEEAKDAVKDLKFDTFLKLKTTQHSFKDGQELHSAINAQYTLNVSAPVAADGGRYRLKLRITMRSAKDPKEEIEALSTELVLQPNTKVLVRGLKLGEGKEMLLVLSVAPPADTARKS